MPEGRPQKHALPNQAWKQAFLKMLDSELARVTRTRTRKQAFSQEHVSAQAQEVQTQLHHKAISHSVISGCCLQAIFSRTPLAKQTKESASQSQTNENAIRNERGQKKGSPQQAPPRLRKARWGELNQKAARGERESICKHANRERKRQAIDRQHHM